MSTTDDFTATFTPGAQDVLRACLLRVEETMRYSQTPESYEDLAQRQKVVIDQMWSLLRALGYTLLLSNDHDGDIRITKDGEHSLFWSFAKSGYHGGVIFHESSKGPEHGTWSTHT